MIEIKYSTSPPADFIQLNKLLDDDYYQRFGEVALKYRPYNTLENIKDFFVAYDHGKPAGCACFRYFDKESAELKRVFILPEYRRQGIAHRLATACEKAAKSQGYRYMVLETGVEMTDAIALYQKLGYNFIDNYGDFAGDTICCCMKKSL